ncbi:MAG: DEAD/DEAH box helicase [Deltaproteobacteria bacterium]|jgi:non-specific serine/threonine protein kinase|nr:DEAD/DEAH box helicase [Deltaproteobacteria bacterium]
MPPRLLSEDDPLIDFPALPTNDFRPITLSPNSFLIFPDYYGDWRERLFDLAATRATVADPTYRFWRSVAEELLTKLCRLPEDANLMTALNSPPQERFESLCAGAPPMPGGEYLSPFSLAIIWLHLSQWVVQAAGPSLADFLASRAPLWKRVGRVTFHLAENKADPVRPFAFLVTYVNSLTSEGRDQHMPLGLALKQYAGQGDHPALLSLLTPVRNAAEKLPWVANMVANKDIYRGLAMSVNRAHRFLLDVPTLEESGLTVSIPDWWRKKPQVKVRVVVDQKKNTHFGGEQLLEWDVGLAVGDEELSERDIQALLSMDGDGLVLFKGRWLEVDRERLREALEHWQEAKANCGDDGLSFIQAMRLLAGLPVSDNEKLELPEPDPWVLPKPGPILEKVLNDLKSPQATEPPSELQATLRPYQKEGLSWLSLLSGLGLGACLADDMGLGKTMQVLALLLSHRQRNPKVGPSLLVAPASLLANWRMEAAKFAPTLKLATWHVSETPKAVLAGWAKKPAALKKFDLVITSYGMAYRQLETFQETHWNMVILDEAQAIKNPHSGQSQAVRNIKAKARLVLTGTPIENRLMDLWSLFDFLNPGLLGSLTRFNSIVSNLAQSESQDQYRPIKRLVAPYLLRRLKSDKRIISDLPDKIETTLYCQLTMKQAKLYNSVVQKLEESLAGLNTDNKIVRSGIVLQSLTYLKQVINHPAQLTGDMNWDPKLSGKFTRLSELCREMAERQEKLLVFTQYKEIIEPLAAHLAGIFGAQGLILHGSTKVSERQKLVARFQDDNGPPFFVLSLKAGGTGLNLTAAGQVIHFDRWWNPAVEDQATDRAYRIGQNKNVLVHKCVTRGTMEERIDNLLTEKRSLAADLLDTEGQFNIVNMDNKALLELVTLDLDKAVMQ